MPPSIPDLQERVGVLEARYHALDRDVADAASTGLSALAKVSQIELALARRDGATAMKTTAMSAGAGILVAVLTLIGQYVFRDPPQPPPAPVIMTPEQVEAWRQRDQRFGIP